MVSLQVGQKVRLNSGGPEMVITGFLLFGNEAIVEWVGTEGFYTHTYPQSCLTPIPDGRYTNG